MDDSAKRRLATIAGHLTASSSDTNTGRVASTPTHGHTSVSKRIQATAPSDVLERSMTGFKRAVTDGRVSDSPSKSFSWKGKMPLSSYRFSQSSVSSGFSHPPATATAVPLAVSLRSANPMSVLTEGPASGGQGAPPVNATPNLNAFGTVTTFDHRRVVNTALHAPGRSMDTHVIDRSSVPAKEWRKYTTKTRGETIAVLDVNKTSLGNLSITHGPDHKLTMNTIRALGHMVNRSAVLAELTQRRGSPGQIKDHQHATARKTEYTKRLQAFVSRNQKSKL